MKRPWLIQTILLPFFVVSNCNKESNDMSLLMDKVQALEIAAFHQNTKIDILEKSNKKLEDILLEKSEKIAYMENTIQQLQQTVMQMATKQAAGYANQTDLLENFEDLSIRTVQEPKVRQKNHRQGLCSSFNLKKYRFSLYIS